MRGAQDSLQRWPPEAALKPTVRQQAAAKRRIAPATVSEDSGRRPLRAHGKLNSKGNAESGVSASADGVNFCWSTGSGPDGGGVESLLATHYSAKVADPERAWAVASVLPSLDLAGRFGIDHFPNVKIEASLPALAARVALRQTRTGPLARALQTLTDAQAAGLAYDGIAHIEAAASASVAGDHELAWQLLAAAGFWSARANSKADPVIFEAACAVARDAGYGELLAS